MTPQERALVEVARLLDANRLPYMVIGGLANLVWGLPRATLDVDVTVWGGTRSFHELVPLFEPAFRVLPEEPVDFVATTRVLPLESSAGVRVDVVFGLLPFEEEAIARAVPRDVGGVTIRFCTAEDLVLMKIISERPKDRDDVRQILSRQGDALDHAYLEPRVHELATLLERPEIEALYRAGR